MKKRKRKEKETYCIFCLKLAKVKKEKKGEEMNRDFAKQSSKINLYFNWQIDQII